MTPIELTHLHADYARRYPAQFAADIAVSTMAEQVQVLQSLPAPLAVGVCAHLDGHLLESLASEHAPLIVEMISATTLDECIPLLNRLPRSTCLALVNQVAHASKRRHLQRFLNYPVHSVGAIVQPANQYVPADRPLQELRASLQAQKLSGEPMLIATDSNGRYAGVIDAWKILLLDGADAPVTLAISAVTPLRAEAAQSRARDNNGWRTRAWLPVVDHESRPVGICRKEALGTSLPERDPTSEHLRPGDLAALFFRLMQSLLEAVLLRGTSLQNTGKKR